MEFVYVVKLYFSMVLIHRVQAEIRSVSRSG